MAILNTAEKALPAGLRAKLSPLGAKIAVLVSARDDVSRAQRMALVAFAVRIVSAGIAFISQIILARLMGEFEYGLFAFVWVLVILFGNLSCLGFHTTVIRFLPGYRLEDAHDKIMGLTSTARIFAMLSASTLALCGFVFLYFFGERIAAYYLIPVALALFTLPMVALGDVLNGTARANGWAISALSPTYIVRPVLILLFMLVAIGLGAEKTATTAMLTALLATYVTTLFHFAFLNRRLNRNFRSVARRIHFSHWMRFAFPVFLIDGIGFLMTNSDVVIVGLYLPPDQVGIYFAAAKTIVLMQFVFFSVQAAAAPRLAALISANDRQELAGFASQAARWAFWPSLAVGCVVLLAGPFLLSLFGPGFVQGYQLMFFLFAGFLAKALIGPGETLLNMAGKQKLCVALYIIIFGCNIALNMLLIPVYGLAGAAAAVAIAMCIEAVLLHVAIRRTLGIVLFAFNDPRAGQDTGKAV
ncbi:Wzx-type polysaccharide biosynthesis protein UppV [Agrobacterium burrii]|uniref:Lipopolysaccharide biosynthesis protein n=1 Tax=Agrobacterium burrii TaxID=2815339 RepID=A0ABS3EE31_9HYPH|nr:Wzx-type polysaccharide biosynthesis protein UppV [Agrobacterium burrii]MBO0130220.1 lipopolysaccharide biosynthesis protein [Agrobacterium burrii]